MRKNIADKIISTHKAPKGFVPTENLPITKGLLPEKEYSVDNQDVPQEVRKDIEKSHRQAKAEFSKYLDRFDDDVHKKIYERRDSSNWANDGAIINASIMLSLVKLAKKLQKQDLLQDASDITQFLLDMLENDAEDKKTPTDILANSVGLQESNIHEYYGGAFSVEPFFFDSGDLS